MKHVCVRACYYLERLWSPGEVFEDIAPAADVPNRHFVPVDGSGSVTVEDEREVLRHGDDPRSTAQMIAALKGYGVEVEKSTPRKEVFARLIHLEQASGKDADPFEDSKPASRRKEK